MSDSRNANEAEAHLLVVDDDARLRDLLRRYLVESGFRVTTAADAVDARKRLQSLAFDLLIIDVMMPGEDGLALTESLRRTSLVPILLLTAMAEPENRIDGLERGADDYLTKPFEPRELVLRIRNILQRAALPPERIAELREALARVLGAAHLRTVPARRGLTRRLRHFQHPPRIDFHGAEGQPLTRLALVCSDRPGLLVAIAQAFLDVGVRVHDARIATFGERAEDVFRITDEQDRPICTGRCTLAVVPVR